MTVSSATNRKTFTGDNVTTSFATSPMVFFTTAELLVYVTDNTTGVPTLLTLNTHYSASGGDGAVGTVSTAGGSSPHGALLSGTTLVILRVIPITQPVDFVNGDNSDAEVAERALDRLTMVEQQHEETLGRAITLPAGDTSGSDTELPDAATRAGTLLGFDVAGLLTTYVVQIGTSIVNLAASAGASLIGYIQTGVGAVLRTVQDRLRERVSVFDYLTTAQIADVQAKTYSLDVSAGVQAAVTASYGKRLDFPGGGYRLDNGISITAAICIQGAGREITEFKLGTNTLVGFNVTSDVAAHFDSFTVFGTTSQSAGAGIKLNGATNGVTTNPHSTIRNIYFLFCWHGVEIVSAYAWRITGCNFFGILDAGVVAGDSVFPDSGDNWISENFFTGQSASATLDGIRHTAGGGLKIRGNAFIELGCAYRMNWSGATGSSQIFLQGNTVDQNMQVAGFLFDSTNANGVFGTNISNNYFDTGTAGIPDIWFKKNAAGWVFLTTISGNTHLISAGAGGVGIQLDGGTDYAIDNEIFVGNANGTCIATGNATATSIRIGAMSFENVLTRYSINTATQIRGGQFYGTSSVDFGNVADGAIGTIGTVTVPGAAIGDICTVGASQLIVGGVLLYATISAANTAKVTAYNKSGGAWNVGAGNVNVCAYRLHA
jgi:hypothetical protein